MEESPIDDEAERRESIAELGTRLIADAHFYIRAEVGRFRALIFRRIVKARLAILFLVSSALLAQSAVLVLLVGALMLLRRYVGIIWSTAIVTLAALIIAAICGWLAMAYIRRALTEEDDFE